MAKSNRKIYEFLRESGAKVEAKCTTVATGILYTYRFFKAAPSGLIQHDQHTIAATCLYLAGKVEEDFIRIRDVINVTHRMLHPDEPLLDVDDHYWSIREGMGRLEMLILRYLGFRLQHEHPHKYLLLYLKTLEDDWLDRDVLTKFPIATTAWSLLNDCYMDPEFILETKPQFIAVAVMYITFQIYDISVPHSDGKDKKSWWRILSGIETTELTKLANKILDITQTETEKR